MLLLLLVVTSALSACSGTVRHQDLGSAGEVLTGLTVDGAVGTLPSVRMRTPLKITDTTTAVTIAGTGAPVQVDQLFVIELTLYDARTGAKAASTYDTGTAVAAKSTDDTLFPVLTDALVGLREGSRLVVAATAADAFGSGGVPPAGVRKGDPVVVVADVVAVPARTLVPSATGTPVPHVPMTPEVSADTDGVPQGVVFTGSSPVTRLQARPIVLGTGPKVGAHDLVTVNYLAQRSGEVAPFEDTYFKEPVQLAIGTGTVTPALDRFLVGARQGSRLLVFGPDKRGMIAWVVDVLGVE